MSRYSIRSPLSRSFRVSSCRVDLAEFRTLVDLYTLTPRSYFVLSFEVGVGGGGLLRKMTWTGTVSGSVNGLRSGG